MTPAIWGALGVLNAALAAAPNMPMWSYAALGFIFGANFGMAVSKATRK